MGIIGTGAVDRAIGAAARGLTRGGYSPDLLGAAPAGLAAPAPLTRWGGGGIRLGGIGSTFGRPAPSASTAGGGGFRGLGATFGRQSNAFTSLQGAPGLGASFRAIPKATFDASTGQLRFSGKMASATTSGWGSDTPAKAGGNWATLDQFDPLIKLAVDRVSQEMGITVPANRVKAQMAVESGMGSSYNLNGVDTPEGLVYSLVGMKPYTAQYWGIDPSTLPGNAGQQIYAMVKTLANGYKMYGDGFGWQGVSNWYFSGNPAITGHRDSLGQPDYTYSAGVENYVKQLDALGGGFSGDWNGPSGTNSGNALAQAAQKYIGDPYVYATAGDIDPATGKPTFDCSGFVYYAYQQATGQSLPYSYRSSHVQYNWGVPVAANELQPGDLLFFDTEGGTEVANGNTASHVAIYLGNGQIIHAANPSTGVIISNLNDPYYQNTFLGARRVMSGGATGGTSGTSGTGGTAQQGTSIGMANNGQPYGIGYTPPTRLYR